MDPLSLALAQRVVGFFEPIVAKRAEELSRTVGVATVDRISGLLAQVRAKLAGDTEATKAIEDFEHEPAQNKDRLTQVLAQKMDADKAFQSDVEAGVKAIGPKLVITMVAGKVQTLEGPEVGDIRGQAVVSVDIRVDDADRITGGKFGDVG